MWLVGGAYLTWVGPKLEVGAEVREAGIIDQGLAVWK